MLASQKISERLKETQLFFLPEPPNRFIRFCRIVTGSIPAALFTLFLSLLRFADFILIGIEADPLIMFSVIGYFSLVYPTLHLSKNRKDYLRASEAVIAAAEALEKQVNQKQMKRMMKITRSLRILNALFICENIANILSIVLLLRYSPFGGSLSVHLGEMYLLPLHISQFIALPLASFSVLTVFLFYIEVTISLTCMFDILGEHFQKATSRGEVHELIRTHQSMLISAKMLDRLLSLVWFSLLFSFLSVVIYSTYLLIAFTFHVFVVLIIISLYAVLSRACILGELVSKSSGNTAFMIYESDWVHTLSQLRGDLSFVILRSQIPCYSTASFLGNMDFRKLLSIGNYWYKAVQALLSLK